MSIPPKPDDQPGTIQWVLHLRVDGNHYWAPLESAYDPAPDDPDADPNAQSPSHMSLPEKRQNWAMYLRTSYLKDDDKSPVD